MVQKRATGGSRKVVGKSVDESKSALSVTAMQKQSDIMGKSINEHKKQNGRLKLLLAEGETRLRQLNSANGFLLDLLYLVQQPKYPLKELDSDLWDTVDPEYVTKEERLKAVRDKKVNYIPKDLVQLCQEIIDTKQIPLSLITKRQLPL